MTRPTSLQTYHQIQREGLLSKMRWQVYDAVFRHGPCTSAEAFSKMQKTGKSPLSQSRARFTELRNAGVLQELDIRKCTVTGRQVIVWEVTKKLPSKLARRAKPTRKQLEDEIYELKKENARLRGELDGQQLTLVR